MDVRHGDTTAYQKRLQSLMPPDIMVTTPETLQGILTGKILREHLRHLKFIIVDEIHELFENKRGVQLSVALERLNNLSDFQRVGLSATIGNPKRISKFLVGMGRKAKVIDVRGYKKYDVSVVYPKPKTEDTLMSQELSINPMAAYNLRKIIKLINKSKSTLIFVNTREMAELLGSRLKKFMKIGVHHSSLSKAIRVEVEEMFKKGELKAIIATSSLELGIDIGDIDLVIQYMSPRQTVKLVQRSGRSGHKRGKTSNSVVFTQDVDDYLEALAIKNKMHQNRLEESKMPLKPYDVLAHQIMGISMELRGVDAEFIYRLVKRAYPFKDLSWEEFQEVLTLLKDIYLAFEYENKIIRSKRGLLYYFNNVSMIPDEKQFIVMDKELNKRVGILHQGFVVEKGEIGSKFVMQGETWRITDIVGEVIEVIRDPHAEGAIPSWEGELIPVSYEIAKEAASYRPKFSFLFKDFKDQKIIPDEKNILVEQYKDHIIIHSCFGTKINVTLAKVLGALITTRVGSSVGIKTDPYRIIFKLPKDKDFKITKKVFDMSPEWVEFIIKTSIKNSSLYIYKFYQIAKRLGIIDKHAEFSQARIKRLMSVFNNTIVSDEVMNELRREKLDIKKTGELIQKIKSGEIKVHFSETISPLGRASIEYGSFSSFIKPEEAYAEIFSMIDKRLKRKKFFFVCTHCNKYIASFRVKTIPKNLKCPFCSAKTIGFGKKYKKDEILKLLNKKELNKDETKILEDLEKTAELFLNYGKDAVYVLAAYGIGPVVGGRILSKKCKTKEDLIFAIVKEERKFIRTRRFW